MAGLPTLEPIGPGVPPAATPMRPVAAAGSFAGLELSVDAYAPGGAPGRAWIHLKAANTGATPIEWTPVPVARRQAAVTGFGSYSDSAKLPGTLAPGEVVSGWIAIQGDPGTTRPGTLELDWLDVAADGYRDVGAVALTLDLPA